MSVDLVNHRQETVGSFALTPVNLVNAQRMDLIELTMRQPHSTNHSTEW
jgi:hypothetical protein